MDKNNKQKNDGIISIEDNAAIQNQADIFRLTLQRIDQIGEGINITMIHDSELVINNQTIKNDTGESKILNKSIIESILSLGHGNNYSLSNYDGNYVEENEVVVVGDIDSIE